MRALLFVMLVAIMGSTALVIRNRNLLKRTIRQVPSGDCTCVEFNECRSNGTVNKFGVTLINIRRIGPCGHYLQVCCKPEDLINSNETISQQSADVPLSGSSLSSSALPESSATDSPVPTSPSSDNLASPSTESPAPTLSSDSPPPSPSPSDNPSSSSPLPSSPLLESSTDSPAPSSTSNDSPTPSSETTDSSSPLPSDLLRNPTTDNASFSPTSTETPFVSSSSPSSDPSLSEDSASTDNPSPSSPLPSSPDADNEASTTTMPFFVPSTDSSWEPSPDDPDSLKNPPRPISQDQYQSPGCGVRNVDGVGFRIIGAKDHEAQFGEFPWVVALLKDDESFICGASLIHPQVVLTSAHCVKAGVPTDKLVARAGEWDRATTREVLPHQDRRIAEVIDHDDFYGPTILNDIALLILEEPFKLTSIVDTVCLPSQDYKFDFSQCVASGWGKENFNSNKDQVILKKVNLPVVPSDTCESILRTTRLGNIFELHDSFICAGGKKGEDTCTGDGGSPLMCPLKDNPARYEQAGIVAWGIGCGDVIPGVYASVARFRDWIDSQLKQRNITIPST